MAVRHWITEWRRRRKAVRAYMRSRKAHHAVRHPETGAEHGARARRSARALPKLPSRGERVRRIAFWRAFQPVIRWHRRMPPFVVVAVYFCTLGAISLAACFWLLSAPAEKERAVPRSVQGDSGVTLALGVPAHKALHDRAPRADEVASLEKLADEKFRARDFAGAEILYRQFMPQARLKALAGFHIYLCLLQQGKSAELKIIEDKISFSSMPKNPFTYYSCAAVALKEGRSQDAKALIDSARAQFPDMSVFYDNALWESGLTREGDFAAP